ncbi:helix-turn-helix domain-containing protein [Hungatella hathewayi]|uniref:helix-turn-helix domain-containing protein n=1 Tax=Hungatella hathewayi TaxID=154046 RepID=UPI00189DC607|nr:helix-turn-helix transcriptional regulator [Hungatella hathewayi]
MYDIFAKLLEERHLKAADVCRGTGLPSSLFSEWKRGKSTPKADKLKKIADFFEVSVEYLMTGDDPAKKEETFNARDERDIKKDLEILREKLANKEYGPAAFDGEDIPDDDADLFLGQVELMLRRLKTKNKEKFNPYKNKK